MGFLEARLLFTSLLPLWTYRKTTKESLAQTSSTITESLMGISRMMAQQVQQSEEAMQTLGKAGPGAGSWARGRRLLHPLTCVASHSVTVLHLFLLLVFIVVRPH